MAKKSKIVREFHLQKKVQRHFELRKELRAIIKNPNVSDEEKEKAIIKIRYLIIIFSLDLCYVPYFHKNLL